MSHLKYSNYKGYGDNHASGYSQAVRVGDRIEISGQGKFKDRQQLESIETGQIM